MHLIVTVHGMWGISSHMNNVVNGIKSKSLQDTIVHNSTCNSFFNTYHGVDQCGLRLKIEITSFIADYNKASSSPISKISFIGYSAGGLIARYCIGLLHLADFFENVKPIHFITIATPHLGIRWNSRNFSGRFFNTIADCVINIYAGRTGTQLALADTCCDTMPLLLEMTTPRSIYYEAWKLFEHKYVYSNASNDNIVPFCTASLSVRNKWRDVDFKQFFGESSDVTDERSNLDERLFGGGIDRQRYKVSVLECGRVDLDDSEIVYPKPRNCSTGNALYILLVFTILLPLGIVHAVILMIPLRLISALCYTRPQCALPPRKLRSDGAVGSDRDHYPWLILRHARTLPIHRVAVYIPGVHTHALIICRRVPNPGGMEVIRHLVDEVLGGGTQAAVALPAAYDDASGSSSGSSSSNRL
jgi:hypothetical protein